ncbi:alpha/beta hydrolase family protein [Colwellia piezophila]|uniref:alpha/beta hydrolase family protein n=1 Tax=Colwellia piezophila TaxID=211668 RepID=UPI000367AD87|nr:S9 family peptidase [Colwellia piezophila]
MILCSKKIISSISLPLLLCTGIANAASVEDFSRHAQYHNVKISPDGKHLAALATVDGAKRLVFLETDTYKVTYSLNANSKNQAADYYWVNNERVVIQVEQMRGALEKPINMGEIYGLNYDGSKKRMIFGYRSKEGGADGGFLIDKLADDPKHVLIHKRLLSRRSDALTSVVKLNIYNGKEREVKRSPMPSSRFLIDGNGQPRFATGVDKNFKTKMFYSKGKGEPWQAFGKDIAGDFNPIAFAQDNNSIYALKSEDGKPQGLYKYNLGTNEETLLYQSDIADPTRVITSGLNDVYGVRVDEDYPKYIYIDESVKDAQLHKALYQAFKGDSITITSKTDDGEKIIVHVSGDRNPGAFYLFNTKTMKTKHIFNARPWIKANEMAASEPFRIKTKDGLVLNGYLTLPNGKDKNLPTVVLPHGGPQARDYWGYHPQVQMLANAGYAVIQVNFRGSTGYGKTFEEAGFHKWGTKIQDDIILAANYAVQQGISDKNRLCLMGTSFGGYSALQSAIREPELFKCAIGIAGVYDLPMLYNEGDIKTLQWGDAFLDKVLGTDVAVQKLQSPVHHVDKLKAAIFIIHGEDDERAPIEHAEALKASLEAINYPFEWLVKDKEGHGFYNEDNILESNQKILSFLDKHIGS